MRKRHDVDKLGLVCGSLHGHQSLNDAVIGCRSRIDLPVSWWIAVEPPAPESMALDLSNLSCVTMRPLSQSRPTFDRRHRRFSAQRADTLSSGDGGKLPTFIHAKTLFVGYTPFVTAADAKEGGWIRSFSRVVQLELCRHELLTKSIFVPFHELPPATRSLCVTAPTLMSSRIFDLILSFPLLEDLAISTYFCLTVDSGDGLSIAVQPPNPPALFTGSLELYLKGGMKPFTHRLLSLLGGIHFWKLSLTWRGWEDPLSTMALVEECQYTLRSLDITCDLPGTSVQHLCSHR